MSAISSELKNILVGNTSQVENKKITSKAPTPANDDFAKLLNLKENNAPSEITLSQHAQKRIEQRSINMDSSEFAKLKLALQSLENKGGRESLVVTDKAAYIMDVANKKIITAMNKQELQENVFTKIDSTVFV